MCNRLPTFYTVSSLDAKLFSSSLEKLPPMGIGINYILDKIDWYNPVLLRCLNDSAVPFILTVTPEVFEAANPNLFGFLFCISTLGSYYREGETLMPVWRNNIGSALIASIQELQDYFIQQGNRQLNIPIIDINNPTVHQLPFTLTFFDEQIRNEQILKQIKEAAVASDCLTDRSFHSQRYYLQELEKWKQRAQLYQEFLHLSKAVQEKEYYDVIDWYQREYEILPLWYKRFGHIIKAFKGKRSFSSLLHGKKKML